MDQETLDQVKVSLGYTVADVNKLLIALGDLPFVQVQGLINDIHQQVGPQVEIAVKEALVKAEAEKAEAGEATDVEAK